MVKYNSSGTQQWSQTYNGAGNSYDGGTALICDSNNDVYVTGAAWTSSTNVDVVTIRYNSSGTAQWTQAYNNASLVDAGATISLVGTSVVVTGPTQTALSTWEYVTLDYAKSNGTLNGTRVTSSGGTSIDRANAVAFDASGNTYITGALGASGQGLNIKTIKLDVDLNIVWTATYNGAANLDDVGRGIGVDVSGNVYVAGYATGSGNNRNAILIQYSSSGSLNWSQVIDPEGGADELADLSLTSSGDLFVGGHLTQKGNKDFFVALYSNTGSLRWSDTYNGLDNRDDMIQQLTPDGSGNFVVCGPSFLKNNTQSLLTIKYAVHTLVKPQNEEVNAPFIENRGQLLDSDGDPADAERYYTRSMYPNVYIADETVSYVFAHIDTIPASDDTLARVDLSFYTTATERRTAAVPLERQDAHHNYYLGHIPEGRERVPLENKVLHNDIYEDIDALYGQGQDGLFIRLICKPGSDPSDIKIQFDGQTAMSVQGDGSLKVETILEDLILSRPTAMTIGSEGTETAITAWQPTFSIVSGKVTIGSIGSYDTGKTLVIKIGRDRDDGEEVQTWWSTYYGWTGLDMEAAADCDEEGFVYTCGRSSSQNFPVGSTVLSAMGDSDWTVNKFDNVGVPQWFVMIGGPMQSGEFRERSFDISVGAGHDLYVGGMAASQWEPDMLPNFNAGGFNNTIFDPDNSGRGAIVRLEKAQGALQWGTFFGDGDKLNESIIAVKALTGGGVAVVGYSHDTGSGSSQWNNVDPGGDALQTTVGDMYIGEFNSTDGLIWATKFGPATDANNKTNAPSDITEDAEGNLFVVGVIQEDNTNGDLFPTGGGSPWNSNNKDGFVAKFAEDRELVWSTCLGGDAKDYCSGVACDPNTGNIIVVGTTFELGDGNFFPIVNSGNPALDDENLDGASDLFLAKFSNSGVLLHSRFFGGDASDYTDEFQLGDLIGTFYPGNAVAVDGNGNVFITGSAGAGLPALWPSPQPVWYFDDFSGGGSDAFVAAFATNFQPQYCTYLGSTKEDHGTGIAVYNSPVRHNIFMVGRTKDQSSDYPTAQEAMNSYYNNTFLGGSFDGVISKIKTNTIIVDAQEEYLPELAVRLSPNPCTDMLTLSVDEQHLNDPSLASIVDPTGRVLSLIALNSGQSQWSLSTAQLIPGVYALILTTSSGHWSGMFVKLKE